MQGQEYHSSSLLPISRMFWHWFNCIVIITDVGQSGKIKICIKIFFLKEIGIAEVWSLITSMPYMSTVADGVSPECCGKLLLKVQIRHISHQRLWKKNSCRPCKRLYRAPQILSMMVSKRCFGGKWTETTSFGCVFRDGSSTVIDSWVWVMWQCECVDKTVFTLRASATVSSIIIPGPFQGVSLYPLRCVQIVFRCVLLDEFCVAASWWCRGIIAF